MQDLCQCVSMCLEFGVCSKTPSPAKGSADFISALCVVQCNSHFQRNRTIDGETAFHMPPPRSSDSWELALPLRSNALFCSAVLPRTPRNYEHNHKKNNHWKRPNAPAGSRAQGTSMGGLYVAATLQALLSKICEP